MRLVSEQPKAGNLNLEDLQKLPSIDFSLETNKKWGRLVFLVNNKGKIEVKKPVVMIHAVPDTVFVDKADYRFGERANHNSYQFSGNEVLDLEPIEISGGPYKYAVDITVPDSIEAFELTFKIHGNNLAHKRYRLILNVKRSPA